MTVLKERRNPDPETTGTEADRLELSFYADPLCCWSWALLPGIEQLEQRFGKNLRVSVCMAGMIPGWSGFSDPLHAVTRPAQMGPVWMDAAARTGIPFEASVWVDDPPASSYPPCIAIKTAALQSPQAERAFMIHLMEALMIHGRNIASREVLAAIAGEVAALEPILFDAGHFYAHYNGEESRSAFRQDLQKASMNRIGRFPTVTITGPGRKGIIFTGYRPYETVTEALFSVAPELRP